MSKPIIVAPSLLSADPLRFGEDIKNIEVAGADWLHIDVMDGHFVPNLTFGPPLIRAIKKIATVPLDVHIMVSNPDGVVDQYLAAGADVLSFHPEVALHSHRIIQTIQNHGVKAGLAINPGTDVSTIHSLLADIDVVMLMSVNPGFGGQTFIEFTVEKIKQLDLALQKLGRRDHVLIEVDGGINSDSIRKVKDAGVDVVVAGSFVFGANNPSTAIRTLREG